MTNLTPDPRHNVVAYLEPTEGYTDAIKWLKTSNISHAISYDIPIYQDHITQFWETAEVKVNTNLQYIKAKVYNKEIQITEETVRTVLNLKDNADDPYKFVEDTIIAGFRSMGYEGNFKRKEVKKTFLSREWRFITHVFCVCVSHRLGGFDGINMEWAGAMLRLCRGEPINISNIIFRYMSSNAQSSEKKLMYPRFVQMILNDKWKDLPKDGDEVEFSRMQSRIFADSNRPPVGFSGKWTPLFDNMYPAERLPVIKKMVERLAKEGDEEGKRQRKKKRLFKDTELETRAKKGKQSQDTLSEIMKLKGEIVAFKNREDERKKDLLKMKHKIKGQKVIIKNLRKALLLQQNALQKMFGMISELQARLGMESGLEFDDLFGMDEDGEEEDEKDEDTKEDENKDESKEDKDKDGADGSDEETSDDEEMTPEYETTDGKTVDAEVPVDKAEF